MLVAQAPTSLADVAVKPVQGPLASAAARVLAFAVADGLVADALGVPDADGLAVVLGAADALEAGALEADALEADALGVAEVVGAAVVLGAADVAVGVAEGSADVVGWLVTEGAGDAVSSPWAVPTPAPRVSRRAAKVAEVRIRFMWVLSGREFLQLINLDHRTCPTP